MNSKIFFKYNYMGYSIHTKIDKKYVDDFIDNYIENKFSSSEIFKNKPKCFVAKLHVTGLESSCLLKIPRERNKDLWHRLLSLFRPSTSVRIYRNFEKLLTLGLRCPVPLMAGERRCRGVVVDSFVLYRFVEGRKATGKDAQALSAEMLKLHSLGYLRGDPHPNNFIVDGDAVYFIDFKLIKPVFFSRYRCLLEYAKFVEKTNGEASLAGWLSCGPFEEKVIRVVRAVQESFIQNKRKISRTLSGRTGPGSEIPRR